jgi:hypothetical protein
MARAKNREKIDVDVSGYHIHHSSELSLDFLFLYILRNSLRELYKVETTQPKPRRIVLLRVLFLTLFLKQHVLNNTSLSWFSVRGETII